jgi:long-chain acyl-CoA synthetase
MKKFRIPIAPGYGMTETVALICLINPSAYKVGSSGKVCDALTLRISPEGEILVKGENVMLGYYKDPEATARKIDKDGWLHTGDKGHLDEDGYLYVEGRLEQDIIVLPNGENIRPDNIESLINALPEVSESIVIARDGHLVALVVPSRASSETSETSASSSSSSLRRKILRTVNPSLPLFSQLYDVEITDQPLARTEKQTLKRYLYS